MGKSMIGPEWTDVATFMSALDTLHACLTVLAISVALDGKSGVMNISLTSTFPALNMGGEARQVVSSSEWPAIEHATLEAHVYGGLYRHDFAISEAYRQKSIAEQ